MLKEILIHESRRYILVEVYRTNQIVPSESFSRIAEDFFQNKPQMLYRADVNFAFELGIFSRKFVSFRTIAKQFAWFWWRKQLINQAAQL